MEMEKQKTPSETVTKMKQGMSYTIKEKTIILNVFKYFKNRYPESSVTKIVHWTAQATGCSEKSIFLFRKEEASDLGFKEPSKTKERKNININSRDIKYDNCARDGIRNVVYNLKEQNIIPSLNKILKQVNEDEKLPQFSLMTLRRLLFDMGFYYEKIGNKSILVEKQSTSTSTFLKDTKPEIEKHQNKSTSQKIVNEGNNSINLLATNSNDILTTNLNNSSTNSVPEINTPSQPPLPNVNQRFYDNFNNLSIHPSQIYNNQDNYRFISMPIRPVDNHFMPGPMHHHPTNISALGHRTDVLPQHHPPPSIQMGHSNLKYDNWNPPPPN